MAPIVYGRKSTPLVVALVFMKDEKGGRQAGRQNPNLTTWDPLGAAVPEWFRCFLLPVVVLVGAVVSLGIGDICPLPLSKAPAPTMRLLYPPQVADLPIHGRWQRPWVLHS